MSQKTMIILGTVVLALLAIFTVWGLKTAPSEAPSPDDTGDPNASIVYFYGKECSHCKDLEKFLEENRIAEKVSFAKKEVWHNTKNSKELKRRADECGVKDIGVPFVWAEGKCFVGGPDAEKFFREKAGI
jgi:glutaredoxin